MLESYATAADTVRKVAYVITRSAVLRFGSEVVSEQTLQSQWCVVEEVMRLLP
jgi:hypothetical protein